MSKARKTVAAVLFAACGSALLVLTWVSRSDQPDSSGTHVEVGAVYQQALAATERTDYALAERLLRRNLQQDPGHHPSRVLLGQVLWSRGDAAAWQLWEQVPATDQQSYGLACYLRGAAALDVSDELTAEEWLLRAIVARPDLLSAIDLVKDLYLLQRRGPELRQILSRRLSAAGPGPAELALDLLAGKAVYGDTAARAALNKFVKAGNASASTRLGLAAVMVDAGDLDAALQLLDSLTDKGGTGPPEPSRPIEADRCLALRLHVAMRLQQDDVAADCVVDLLRMQSLDCAALASLGEWCLQHDQQGAARQLLEQAAARCPLRSDIWSLAGQAAAQSDQESAARSSLLRATAADELERDAYLILRGNSNRQLLVRTMRRIAANLQVLDEQERAAAWSALAGSISGSRAQISDAVLADYRRVLDSASARNLTQRAVLKELGIPTDRVRESALAVLADDSSTRSFADNSGQTSLDGQFLFEDIAAAAGLHFQYDPGRSTARRIVETIGGGVCVLDYDGDGLPDLFFPQGGRAALHAVLADGEAERDEDPIQTDRLFRNLGDGRYSDVSVAAGIHGRRYSLGAAAVDHDNDGDTDLVVGTIGQTLIYDNLGDGTFARSTLLAESDTVTAGIGVGDFNADSVPDFWLVNYVADWRKTCVNARGDFSTCLPASYPPQSDRLLIADASGDYDVREPDLSGQPAGRGLGIATLDFNGDGRTDAYVANDGSANHLFLSSQHPTTALRESAMLRGCALSGDGRAEAGMGIAVADFNGDLNCDLFVTNFTHESNRLYSQDTNRSFRDVSARWGVPALSLPLLGFGVQAADFNSDGYPDLLVANGHINDNRDIQEPYQMPAQLLANVRGESFQQVSAGACLDIPSLGRGVALLDFDRDARMDAVIVHQDRPASLLHNRAAGVRSMRIRLAARQGNRDAINAVIDVETARGTTRQWSCGSHGYMATNERSFVFPLPDGKCRRIRVQWPSGEHTTIQPPDSVSSVIIREDGRWFHDAN